MQEPSKRLDIQHTSMVALKKRTREFLMNLFAGLHVPIRTMNVISIKEKNDWILLIVEVSFQNWLSGERREIIIPIIYNKKYRVFERPSVFYLGRSMHVLAPETIRTLFIDYREPPSMNIFSPYAPLFFDQIKPGG